jgi:hypothetical protein
MDQVWMAQMIGLRDCTSRHPMSLGDLADRLPSAHDMACDVTAGQRQTVTGKDKIALRQMRVDRFELRQRHTVLARGPHRVSPRWTT